MKPIMATIAIAILVGGCELPEALRRIGNVQQHCGLVRGTAGWANVSFQCVFLDNPFESAALHTP